MILFDSAGESCKLDPILREMRGMNVAGSIIFHAGELDSSSLSLCDGGFPCLILSPYSLQSSYNIKFIIFDIEKRMDMAIGYLRKQDISDIWIIIPMRYHSLFNSTIKSDGNRVHLLFSSDIINTFNLCIMNGVGDKGGGVIAATAEIAIGISSYRNKIKSNFPIISLENSSLIGGFYPSIVSIAPSGYQYGAFLGRYLVSEIEKKENKPLLPQLRIVESSIV